MTWSKIAPRDGKPRYLKRQGTFIVVTREKRGSLNEMPEGWEVVVHKDGNLRPKKIE